MGRPGGRPVLRLNGDSPGALPAVSGTVLGDGQFGVAALLRPESE